MIRKVTQIEQPCFGEYEERIYDIESPWNSSDWTWIVIEEDASVWCGEFRERELKSIDSIILPINADEIKLVRYEGKYLVMESTEICNWEKTYILKLDCESLEIIECD